MGGGTERDAGRSKGNSRESGGGGSETYDGEIHRETETTFTLTWRQRRTTAAPASTTEDTPAKKRAHGGTDAGLRRQQQCLTRVSDEGLLRIDGSINISLLRRKTRERVSWHILCESNEERIKYKTKLMPFLLMCAKGQSPLILFLTS